MSGHAALCVLCVLHLFSKALVSAPPPACVHMHGLFIYRHWTHTIFVSLSCRRPGPFNLFRRMHRSYGTKIPPSVLSDRLAAYVHYFTLHGALRPFGATALVASYDDETKEHALHMIEPSGMSHRYFACAAGKGRQPAKTEMEKLTLNNREDPAQNISVREGVKQLARIIHALHDEAKDKPFELEMSWLCEESGWKHKGVPRDVIKESVEWAKKDIEEAEEEDEDSDEEMEG